MILPLTCIMGYVYIKLAVRNIPNVNVGMVSIRTSDSHSYKKTHERNTMTYIRKPVIHDKLIV